MSTETTDVQRRAQAALALRIAGATFSEIAQHLAYGSPALAAAAVERELRDSVTDEQRNKLRDEENVRILRLLRSVWRKATSESDPEHLYAVKTALALIDRHARLLGLDMPQEVIVYNPTQREIEDWVQTMVSQASNSLEIIEADIA